MTSSYISFPAECDMAGECTPVLSHSTTSTSTAYSETARAIHRKGYNRQHLDTSKLNIITCKSDDKYESSKLKTMKTTTKDPWAASLTLAAIAQFKLSYTKYLYKEIFHCLNNI